MYRNIKQSISGMLAVLLVLGIFADVPFLQGTRAAHAEVPIDNLLPDYNNNFAAGNNPFKVKSNSTGGITQLITENGEKVVELRDTSSDNNGGSNSQTSDFTTTLDANTRMVKRINEVYSMPVGSEPVDFVFEFKLKRTAMSNKPLSAQIQAFIEFQNHDNGVSIPRFPTSTPILFNTQAYKNKANGIETMELVTAAEVPGLKISIKPNGGARKITYMNLGFSIRVDTNATDEAFAVKDIVVREVPHVPEPEPPFRGLIAHWDFQQVTADGKVADLTGRNHTATVINAEHTPNGRVSNGMYFKGKDSYVDAGPASDYDLTDAFTVAMWVLPEEQEASNSRRHRFISWLDGFRRDGNGFELGFEAQGTRYDFMMKNATTKEVANTYFPITTRFGKWMHLAVSWDASSKTAYFYIDGKLTGKHTYNGPLAVPNGNVWIGRGGEGWHKGTIDEVKMYNKALTEAEIQTVYNDLPAIPVASVAMNKTELTVAVGASEKLDYTIEPFHAKDLNVFWHNSNPAVASVDLVGNVTGKSEGTAVITVTTRDGGKTTQTNVQVVVRHPAEVTLNKASTTIEVNKTETLAATVLPADTTDKTILWSSDNPAVAAVDIKGIVKGIGTGTATITATTRDGGKTASAQVTVSRTAVSAINLNKTAFTLPPGKSEKLVATITPTNATNKDRIRWSSNNPAVAAVDDVGVVIAKASGQAVISATAEDGGLTKTSTVTVPQAGKGIWSQVFVLRDYLNLLDYPEELIGYVIQPPANTVKKNGLKLTTSDGAALEYELANVVEKNGFLESATIRFRTSLERNEIRGFVLDYDPDYNHSSQSVNKVTIQDNGNGTATLSANDQQVRVPYGVVSYPDKGMAPEQVAAPVIAIAKDGQNWTGSGKLLQLRDTASTGEMFVTGIEGKVIEQGPLMMKYEIKYTLTFGLTYVVVLTVQHNEKHIKVHEKMNGISVGAELYFKFSMNGIDPDGRLVMSNNGYISTYSGKFTDKINAGGKLPYELGLYSVNNLGVMRATVFWKDAGENALVFSLYDMEKWKTSRRFYYAAFGPQNLNFYSVGSDNYMMTRLERGERYWALGLIDRAEVIVKGRTLTNVNKTWLAHSSMTGYDHTWGWGAGPEVMLFQKLTEFSLDRNKDRVFDWEEDPSIRFEIEGEKALGSENETDTFATWDEYWRRYKFGPYVERYMDASYSQRGDRYMLEQYANSRWSWTPEQRQRARALIAFNAYMTAGDVNQPHISMLAGHANFVIDVKQALAITVGIIPEHPAAPEWKRQFMLFYNGVQSDKESYKGWLDHFLREANEELNTKGGRWHENPATYSLASLEPLMYSYRGLKQYDGTDIFDHPGFREWIEWNIDILVPTEGGGRELPPQGAHADKRDLPEGEFANVFYAIAGMLMESDNPENVMLGNHLLWSKTKGTQGINPQLESVLYTDYGAVMRYDFGGPNEAYLNIQQMFGSNYRWHNSSNGTLLYTAKGRRWSWNEAETNGDSLNVKLLPAFVPENSASSLNEHIVDGVLYNFDFAQYYKAEGKPGQTYLSRSVMMVRDDFISVYDDMSNATAKGTFHWNNTGYGHIGQTPHIVPVKPGPGDQMHIVAPKAEPGMIDTFSVNAAVYGAVVGEGEYVFSTGSNEAALSVQGGAAVFEGKVGYASEQGLALFEGAKIGLNGFVLERAGGDFGISAEKLGNKQIKGRFAGKSGGTVRITLPEAFETEGLSVAVNGAQVAFELSEGVLSFDVGIAQRDGYKSYVVQSSESEPVEALSVELSDSGSGWTNQSVTVTAAVYSEGNGYTDAVELLWAAGVHGVEAFPGVGTSFAGSFTIEANGIYTVYAKDSAGLAAVAAIAIGNIDKTAPTITWQLDSPSSVTDPVTVTVAVYDGEGSGVIAKKWANGMRDADYFAADGTVFEQQFLIVDNGAYTIYAQDAAGNRAVANLTLNRQIQTGPDNTYVTGPVANPTPACDQQAAGSCESAIPLHSEVTANLGEAEGKPEEGVPQAPLEDIGGHWAEKQIREAAVKGLVNGYPDNSFLPERSVSRAEFVVMLMRAIGMELEAALSAFTDQALIGGWAQLAIAQAVQAGIVDGYEDSSFRPDASISRAEMAVIIVRALQGRAAAGDPGEIGFADEADIPVWARDAVAAAVEHGILNGRGDNMFAPNETATRAEAAVTLLRFLQATPGK